MITNFEQITEPLTDNEKAMIKVLVPYLNEAIGKRRAVSNAQIVDYLRGLGFKTSSPRVRQMIHCIRVGRMVTNLVATSNGYHIATTYKEISEYIKSLKEREESIRSIRQSFENPVLFI